MWNRNRQPLAVVSRIREMAKETYDLKTAILKSAEERMRPVLMTSLAVAIGLLPAAVSTGMGLSRNSL